MVKSTSAGETATVCLFEVASMLKLVADGEVEIASGDTAADMRRALAAKGETDAGSSKGGTVDSSRA